MNLMIIVFIGVFAFVANDFRVHLLVHFVVHFMSHNVELRLRVVDDVLSDVDIVFYWDFFD